MRKIEKIKRHTITAALPYANGPLHIGHFAGVYLPADIYARYLRSNGKEVAFICGTDEHGAAINIKAKQEGISPQAIVDKYHAIIKKSMDDFDISFDVFSRTSKPIHHKTAQSFFKKFLEEGKLIEKTTQQLFDPTAKLFLADRYVTGKCPKCEYPDAYGDQCENCGSSLNATDLINPKSTLSGEKPILKETVHWYLPLDQYQERLEKFILEDHKDWKPNVYGQCKSWLKEGLQPRAITRDLDWGVKVPVAEGKGKTLYVWFDAPIGYISATKEWAEKEGKDWKLYWQDEETSLVHFLGKDNIVFHCIIFPAILMGHGDFILPENVPANEFLNLEGEKISTSRNWAIWLNDYVKDFPEKTDVLRYVLTATMPEAKDNNFTWEDFQKRNNNELVGDLGNYINRVLVLTHKYFDGVVPKSEGMLPESGHFRKQIQEQTTQIGASIEKFRFREAMEGVMNLSRIGNKFLADTEPWKKIKSAPEAVPEILFECLQSIVKIAICIEPFLPKTAQKIFDLVQIEPLSWKSLRQEILLTAGHHIDKAKLLFEKIEDEAISAQIEKLNSTNTPKAKLPEQKELIDFEVFQKMDLRVGTILDAAPVPKTKKLLKLTVDIGLSQRTVVSGIADQYDPAELSGKQCIVLINLVPRKIRGVESQGMLLFAEDTDGKLKWLSPQNKTENGSSIN